MIKQTSLLIKVFLIQYFSNRTQYFFAAFTNCILITINYYFWATVLSKEMAEYKHLLLYVLLAAVLRPIIIYFRLSHDIGNSVRLGNILSIILKPVNMLQYWISQQVGRVIVFAFIIVGPLLINILILNHEIISLINYDIRGVISILLAIYISTLISVCIGLLGFWFQNTRGLNSLNNILFNFASGALIPLSIMPNWAKNIIVLLPYRTLIDIPVHVMIYNEYTLIFVQIIWCFVITFVYIFMSKYAYKRLEIVGS